MNDELIRQFVETVIAAIAQGRVKSGMTLGEVRIAAKLETTNDEFDSVIEVLKMLELIELESVPPNPKGGRPTQRIMIAPGFEVLKLMLRRHREARTANLEVIADSLREAFAATK